jgi:hypothetical protein
LPKGGKVAIDPQSDPQGFEGEAGVIGHGGAKFGFVTAVERYAVVAGRTGFDFAGGLITADKLSDPLRTGGILASEFCEGQSSLEVGKHPGSQIEGESTHGRLRIGRNRSIAYLSPKRKTETQNALV